jgi:hypothetical protein
MQVVGVAVCKFVVPRALREQKRDETVQASGGGGQKTLRTIKLKIS